MPNGNDLPEALSYIPWWRKGDPGPDWPWLLREISAEAKVQLAVSQMEYEKDMAAAYSKVMDRNMAILKSSNR